MLVTQTFTLNRVVPFNHYMSDKAYFRMPVSVRPSMHYAVKSRIYSWVVN